LKNLAELDVLHASHPDCIVFITPFCAAREKSMDVRGDEDILAILVENEMAISPDDLSRHFFAQSIRFQQPIAPTLSDEAFAEEVRQIQDHEIAAGNACQVVYSRKFEGLLEAKNPLAPLILFTRLLRQPGAYFTFLFSDGKGHYFVGASPERHLEIQGRQITKNPIAGTMSKGRRSDFEERLKLFLNDPKEINELSQVLDEELKIMAQICPQGGKILGPFLRESGSVIHTEYHLVGHSDRPALESFRISLHASTVVGSPLQSAFRIIAKREKGSRRYYGGEIGILEKNGDLFSAILIRTAEIFEDGRVTVQAGAGIVRDSIPAKEALETTAKASGLITAFTKGDAPLQKPFLTPGILERMRPLLQGRNRLLSSFLFEDQVNVIATHNAKHQRITIVDNEDNFSQLLAHMTRHMGYTTHVVDTFEYSASSDPSDMVILGAGPGDINDHSNGRMVRLLAITKELMDLKKPLLGICLGLQAMAKTRGILVLKQPVPTQGVQKKVMVLGALESVGFYNSFSPIQGNRRMMVMEGDRYFGVQFHPESVMTKNGYDLLKKILLRIAPVAPKTPLDLEIFVKNVLNGNTPIEEQKQFFSDLNERGTTPEDLAGLVRLFQNQMTKTLVMPGALDVCGTGGSGLSRINTSTLSAFVLAACGVPVAKHGNKAATGRFGSFDLLESLGIDILADKIKLESLYAESRLAFIYARQFHPAFRHFAQARQELGVRTIFNFLGPLLNPANPEFQIIGAPHKEDLKLVVEAAHLLGKKHVLAVCGSDGLDEVTLTGETAVMELQDSTITSYTLTPEDFGLKRVRFSAIQGGNPDFNVRIARQILAGTCATAHLDLVLANVALALKFTGRAGSLPEGVAMAREALQSGKTQQLFQTYGEQSHTPDILLKIAEDKRAEVEALKKQMPLDRLFSSLQKSDRDFKAAISKNGLNLIAEIKKGSPSAGTIYKGELLPGTLASLYEKSGADAISVLTDEKYFRGSLGHLRLARESTQKIPLLMKDFIVDEYQIYLARYYGADAILLIASLLTVSEIDWFLAIARALNMDALVEVHDARELEKALQTKADIIGINNRNLHTFDVDVKNFLKLRPRIPDSKLVVAESGYHPANTEILQGLANAVLVGTSILKSDDMIAAIRKIKAPRRQFKACGIRSVKAARFCDSHDVGMIGINFVPTSPRYVDFKTAKSICSTIKHAAKVGVFQNQSAETVNGVAAEMGLDFIQLAGEESPDYCQRLNRPILKTIRPGEVEKIPAYSKAVCMFVMDGLTPGSGRRFDYSALKTMAVERPFLIAGGVDETNVKTIFTDLPQAVGIDVASGIETHGQTDLSKIERLSTFL